jgi:ATP-dependent Clp protease ATP-binding subunit ClpA
VPSFSRSLEKALHQALALANERQQEYATLEHLLLALLDDQDAAAVMRACNVDLDTIRQNLIEYIETELDNLVTDSDEDAKPTAGFQRVIQRAVIHVQSSGREEVTGANVLVAIFAERESHAAYFLQDQDMTRYDAVNYISHGIAKRPGMSETRPVEGAEEEDVLSGNDAEKKPTQKTDALEAYCVNLNEKAEKGKIDPLIGREAKSRGPSRSCAAGPRTIRCSSVTQVWARRRLLKVWPTASSMPMCLKFCRMQRSFHSTWARCSQVRAIAVISKSG